MLSGSDTLEVGDVVANPPGTASGPCVVQSHRMSHHGRWYVFRSLEFGDRIEGYAEGHTLLHRARDKQA
jgi:2-keto-4-pentenoate hydratase/2-oxohepta-3-ene-1,7-dioic acid hydratase in catechol pathway